MIGCGQLRAAVVLLALVSLLTACAGSGMSTDAEELTPSGNPLLAGLPDAEVLRDAALTVNERLRWGGDYLSELPNRFTEGAPDDGIRLRYEEADQQQYATGAFCGYGFYLPEWTGAAALRLYWDDAPAGDYWLGLGKWSARSWQWFRPEASHRLEIGELGPYLHADGYVVVMLVVPDPDLTVLSRLELESTVQDTSWEREIIGPSGQVVGGPRGLVCGPDDVLHAAYQRTTVEELPDPPYYNATYSIVYATRLASGWESEVVTDDSSLGLVAPALALGPDDAPAISWFEPGTGFVRTAIRDGDGWLVEDVEYVEFSDGSCDILVDADGVVHVVFANHYWDSPAAGYVRHAERGPSGWSVESINYEDPMADVAVSLAQVGDELTLHYRVEDGALNRAQRSGEGWNVNFVLGELVGGGDLSMAGAVAGDGTAFLMFRSGEGLGEIKLVRRPDFLALNEPKLEASSFSLSLDQGGTVHVAAVGSLNYSRPDLVYYAAIDPAMQDEGMLRWDQIGLTAVERAEGSHFISIQADSDGTPHILTAISGEAVHLRPPAG